MSFSLHGALLLALAIASWITPRPGRPAGITISTVAPRTEPELTPLPETEFTLAEQVLDLPPGLPTLPRPVFDHSTTVDRLLSELATGGAAGTSPAARPPQASADVRPLPQRAVQAGSFTAWWIPKVERYGERVEPGQFPRIGQDYRIHVQIRVPDHRPVFRLDDLSGEIVGSDGYRQLIPDRAWIHNEKGELVSAAGHRHVRVQGGVAEIVFKVDAAGKAGVRDTISIRSRSLNESQTLTLEFQPLERSE